MSTPNKVSKTLATPRNMILARERGVKGFLAYDEATGETFSATRGDYFSHGLDEPLTSSLTDEALILAVEVPATYRDALTGEPLPYAPEYDAEAALRTANSE